MRQGTLFHQNKEPVSVFFEDLRMDDNRGYIVQDVDAVFHPVQAGLTFNQGVLSQTQADADFRVVLGEANDRIKKTDTLLRNAGTPDEREYEIVDVLSFGGAMHVFVSEEGI